MRSGLPLAMARIPYVTPDIASPPVRDLLERLPVPLNIFKIMAHAQSNFRAWIRLGGSILGDQLLDARLRELAILRVAQITPARYEWVQHVPIALATGATAEQIDALDRGDTGGPCFSDEERLVLDFTTEVLRDVRASDATFMAMTRRFSPQEIVELLLAIGFYMTMARVMETTDIDLEPAAGQAMVEALKQQR